MRAGSMTCPSARWSRLSNPRTRSVIKGRGFCRFSCPLISAGLHAHASSLPRVRPVPHVATCPGRGVFSLALANADGSGSRASRASRTFAEGTRYGYRYASANLTSSRSGGRHSISTLRSSMCLAHSSQSPSGPCILPLAVPVFFLLMLATRRISTWTARYPKVLGWARDEVHM